MSRGLRPALSLGPPGLHGLHQHAVLEAVNAADRARKPFAEADADRAAGDLVAGRDQVVVDLHHGVRRHGEADALVAEDCVKMAVLTPITSLFILSSGPPELPGLMAASVWRKCWNCPLRRPAQWCGSWRR
jgi:hypothetical protein